MSSSLKCLQDMGLSELKLLKMSTQEMMGSEMKLLKVRPQEIIVSG